jgi:energy-coupling factor transporter ATP-binding protein EcfA2
MEGELMPQVSDARDRPWAGPAPLDGEHAAVVRLRSMARGNPAHLQVRKFAQIDKVDLELGDLTVLVGPQASGKSLVLQLLKLAIDGRAVAHTSREHDLLFHTRREFLDRYFGEGSGSMWTSATSVQWNGKEVQPDRLARTRQTKNRPGHTLYFIPAHRTLVLANGYPLAFQQMTNETPFVVRLFSEDVREILIRHPTSEALFSTSQRRLKQHVRAKLDEAIFHGATLHDDSTGSQRRLLLSAGKQQLPYMTWTAGQRELIPLLLGSYFLLPAGGVSSRTDWVVIEEPEMGLHPRGISAVFLLVLDFLSRGYKVVLSTHAPLVLDLVWAIQRLKQAGASWQSVLKLFGIEGITKANAQGEAFMATEALTKDYRVYMFDFDARQRVKSHDISSLDPSSVDAKIAGWGDLTGLSGQIAEVVADAVNAAKRR